MAEARRQKVEGRSQKASRLLLFWLCVQLKYYLYMRSDAQIRSDTFASAAQQTDAHYSCNTGNNKATKNQQQQAESTANGKSIHISLTFRCRLAIKSRNQTQIQIRIHLQLQLHGYRYFEQINMHSLDLPESRCQFVFFVLFSFTFFLAFFLFYFFFYHANENRDSLSTGGGVCLLKVFPIGYQFFVVF